MISSVVFIDYYLCEFFQINWLVFEMSKLFHAYSDAKGSLFRLWHRLWHVMLDVILIIYLVVIFVAWLFSNIWEFLMRHWKNHVLFPSYKSIVLWYSLLMLYLGWLGTSRKSHITGTPKYIFCGTLVVRHIIFTIKIRIWWRTCSCTTELRYSVVHLRRCAT
jgi:hypothetical protein